MPVNEYQNLTIEGRQYEEKYLDYWNSTSKDDGRAHVLNSVLLKLI